MTGTAAIVRQEGISGCYRGLVPVVLRQGANSMVRLGSYSTLKNLVQGSSRPGQTLPGGVTFGIGALAGVITVYSTMPFDTVKTRMQSIDAKSRYKGTIDCFVQTVKTDGVLALWRGSTTRLARLVLSGGIVFTIYEEMMSLMGAATV